MSRYIDVDKLVNSMNKRLDELYLKYGAYDHYSNGYSDAIDAVENAPTADVVEVVRCKDCKHHPDNGGECDRSITHTERDYNALLNSILLANLNSSDPKLAKILNVFLKKGIPIMDAMAMLLEIGAVIQEANKEGENNG